jgi:hypothetical protein
MFTTREGFDVGCRVRLPDDREGTIVPTSPRVPETEVNVMLDFTGSVVTCKVATLGGLFWPTPPPDVP